MARYEDNIDAVLTYHGPIDEPSYCFKAAEAFARGRNARQAAQYLRRTLVFDPTNLVARVGLVSMYNQIQQFELARELIRDIRAKSGASLPPLVQLELTQAEATTYLGRDNLAESVRILEAAQKTFPTNVEPYAMLVEVYLQRGDVTNAFKVLDSQLKAQPEQTGALVNYARIKILSKQFADAIPYLDRALKVQSRDPFALINRAIANLKVGNLAAAESDYTAVHNLLPKPTYPVLYGLHEVAWLKKDRKQATKWGKEFLKLAPANSPDVKVIKDRLEQIKAGVI
jgi:tetratricopeptide (TPR) repeat protein